MTKIADYGDVRIVVISADCKGKCEECHKEDELRPYGKNFARICVECARKDMTRTKLMMHKVWSGETARNN